MESGGAPTRSRSSRAAWISLAAVAAVIAVLLVVDVFVDIDLDDDRVATAPSSTTTSPTTTVPDPLSADSTDAALRVWRSLDIHDYTLSYDAPDVDPGSDPSCNFKPYLDRTITVVADKVVSGTWTADGSAITPLTEGTFTIDELLQGLDDSYPPSTVEFDPVRFFPLQIHPLGTALVTITVTLEA